MEQITKQITTSDFFSIKKKTFTTVAIKKN